MKQVKNAQQKLYSTFMLILAAVLLTACSDKTTSEPTNEQQVESTSIGVEAEKEVKDDTNREVVLEIESRSEKTYQITEEVQEEPVVSSFGRETLTLDEFIARWNEIDPGRLSEETKIEHVENGFIRVRGSVGSDSYAFTMNEKDRMMKQVTFNLSYGLPEDGGGLSDIPRDISVLMDVLEPELEPERKLEMLNILLNTNIYDVSVSHGPVTYKVSNGDDMFRLEAVFE